MLGKARKADVNTVEIGEQIAERKDELKAALGVEEHDAAATPRARTESRKSGEKRK